MTEQRKLSDEALIALLKEIDTGNKLKKKTDIEIGRLAQDHLWPMFDNVSIHHRALFEEMLNRLIQPNCEHKNIELFKSQGVKQCQDCHKVWGIDETITV